MEQGFCCGVRKKQLLEQRQKRNKTKQEEKNMSHKLPPWIYNPLVPLGDIRWRMANETFMVQFHNRINAMSTQEKRFYLQEFPPPCPCWEQWFAQCFLVQ